MESNRRLWAVSVFLFASVFTLLAGDWPEVYGFAASSHSALKAPIHLSDDVMISLRSGYILNETGTPALNHRDLAQPSTSYVSPYLFALLLKVFPQNISVAVYALLGFLAATLTLSAIVFFAKSSLNGVLLALALVLTRTHLEFALNGWDHLFQGLCLTLATCLGMQDRVGPGRMLLVAILLAFGSLWRPDGLLISIAILGSLYSVSPSARRLAVYAFLAYASIMALALAVNLVQFGHLTPTTARLKVGASPSLGYALRYVAENGVVSYTALTLIAMLVVFFLLFRRALFGVRHLAIVLGCVVTAAVAAYNSDAFTGARMFWSPACVLASMVAVTVPAFVVFDRNQFFRSMTIAPTLRERVAALYASRYPVVGKAVLFGLVGLPVAGTLLWGVFDKARQATVTPARAELSISARQYVVARWIDASLKPSDGPIGLFYLGVSYHMPQFEIADFLGKADELIAGSGVKWGRPGHNKWDIDKTLAKWAPQAIVPPSPDNPTLPGAVEDARAALAQKQEFGFAPALMINDTVAREYSYCYIPTSPAGIADQLGFFLRKDIAAAHASEIKCSPDLTAMERR